MALYTAAGQYHRAVFWTAQRGPQAPVLRIAYTTGGTTGMDNNTYSGTGTTANQNTNPDYEPGYRDGCDHAIYTVPRRPRQRFHRQRRPSSRRLHLKSTSGDYRAYAANQRP